MTKKLMRYRTILVLTSLLTLGHMPLHAQLIVNIGFRLGYISGPESGFIGGMDLSITAPTGGIPQAAGVYFSIEFRPDLDLTHFGVEAFPTYWTGIGVGLSEIWRKEIYDSGMHAMIFGGMIALPYYQITIPKTFPIMHGVGTFVKLPIPIGFSGLSVG